MEWNRKLLKQKARQCVWKNYAYLVAVCFLVAFLAGESRSTLLLMTKHISNNFTVKELFNIEENPEEYLKNSVERKDGVERYAATIQLSVLKAANQDNGLLLQVAAAYIKIAHRLPNAVLWISIIGIIVALCYALFVESVLIVGKRRYLLENRVSIYSEKRTSMALIIGHFKKEIWWNTVYCMFFRWLYQGFWNLTVVGGIIKYYEYKNIPFLLAENPNLTKKEVFAYSKELSDGYKMKMFMMDLSFWYWIVLQFVTMGMVGLFFYEPYRMTTDCEMYFALRSNVAENKAKDLVLEVDYYEKNQMKQTKVLNPERTYTIKDYVFIFFLCAFVGWLWEAGIHIVEDGMFVNRGFSYGPWLPIYGVGAVGSLLLFKRYCHNPFIVFWGIVVMASVIEYITSWVLEKTTGALWWDYHGYFLNVNGRICLLGAGIFAVGGCAIIYLFAPVCAELFQKIPHMPAKIICIVLCSLLVVDLCFAVQKPNKGTGVNDYHEWELHNSHYGIDEIRINDNLIIGY